MSTNSGLDTWSAISGAIGVLTILPLLCACLWTQHPETKFAQLDATLKDTENLLRSVVEEGLLDPERHVAHFELHLIKFRRTTEQYRDETFIASNEWRKLLEAWYNGLSKRISLLCKQIKAVRASICETSANARMQLMPQSHEEAVPIHRRWQAKVARFWTGVISLVCRTPPHDVTDAPASTTPATLTSTETDSLAGDGSTAVAEDAASTHDICHSLPPPRKASIKRPNLKFSPASRRVSRTASRAHDLHVLARAIRRVDRELTTQGVTHTLLAQLVQATHQRWSPASSKAHRPRRSRNQHNALLSSRPKHVLALQHVSEPDIDSDVESSGEETMCELTLCNAPRCRSGTS